jgi:outer membrane autotransporter protein
VLNADTAYARDYRQNYNGLTVGADRSFVRDADSGSIGFSIAQVRSTANYEQGKGELKGTTLGLYSGWAADNGPYLLLGADLSLLENSYSARDSQNREIAGKYRTQAARTYAEGGYPFELANGYYVEPQLGLSVGTIRGNRHTTGTGVQIEQDRLVSSVARAGVEIGKTLQGPGVDGGLYVRASALRYQGDSLEISATKDGGSIAPDTAERNGTGSEFVLGGDVGLGNTRLFIEASSATAVDAQRNWAVQAGLRHNW